jgi:hypothetical protein
VAVEYAVGVRAAAEYFSTTPRLIASSWCLPDPSTVGTGVVGFGVAGASPEEPQLGLRWKLLETSAVGDYGRTRATLLIVRCVTGRRHRAPTELHRHRMQARPHARTHPCTHQPRTCTHTYACKQARSGRCAHAVSGARSYLEGAYTRHLMDSPPASPLGLPEIDHNVVRAWQESSNVCPATDADFRSRLRRHAPSACSVGMLRLRVGSLAGGV